MQKRQRVESNSSDLYDKTEKPSILYHSKHKNWSINIRYRKSSTNKYIDKSTSGYPCKEDAEADSVWFRNAWENGTFKQWKSYNQRGRQLLNEAEKLFFTLKSINVNSNERSYVPMNAAKRSAHKKLNKLCKHLNLTNEERLELNSNLSACKSKKWGIDYIKVLKSLSNYYRTLLSKSEMNEVKLGTKWIDDRIESYKSDLDAYTIAIDGLNEVKKEDSYWKYIKVDDDNIVDPISDSDFSIKLLNRLNRQCHYIRKL